MTAFPPTKTRRVVAFLAAAAMFAGACSGGDPDTEPTTTTPGTTRDPGGTSTAGGPTLTIGGGTPEVTGATTLGLRLTEGRPETTAAASTALVDGTPLTDEEVAAILARLPQWDVPDTDREEFNRPPDSLRPPLVGETVERPFPPPTDPGTDPIEPATGPLDVLRLQPEGDVDVAPFLSVTFDEPMVPLATLEQLDAADVPAAVTPAIEGRWRWIGTRTLRFEVEPGATDRLPAATEYTVEIPAGTTSANGAVLPDAVSWTFSTPAPSVDSFVGLSDSMVLDPMFVITFDQRVDAAAVLAATTMNVAGSARPLRIATQAEIDADDRAAAAMSRALPDRAVTFTSTEWLPRDAMVTVEIGPGAPSLEGPRTTIAPEAFSGRTYGPLGIGRAECSRDECVPLAPFNIEFTNALDTDTFDVDFVRISPELPGANLDVFGRNLVISGATAGQTTYTVTVSAQIQDLFGQTLGRAATLTFEVGRAHPLMRGPDQEFVTVDPAVDRPTLGVTTVNHDALRLTAWAVEPGEYGEYSDYLDDFWSDENVADPRWQEVLDTQVDLDAAPDEFVEHALDLTEAFDASGGPIVVRVETTPRIPRQSDHYWSNRPFLVWVQRTTLGVDAFVTDEELLIWTTDLRTGAPVGGANVDLLGVADRVTTDSDGLARVQLTSVDILGLVATSGDQQAMLPSRRWSGWERRTISAEGRWYVFDDRGVYRPGESARLTGWVRRLTSDDAQLELVGSQASVVYTVSDPQGNELASGTVPVNALGGFNLTIDVPEAANTGQARVDLSLSGADGPGSFESSHTFQIQDFRTPEFEVTARNETPAPHYVAAPATVAVEAEYFSGGPLPDAEVNWLVRTSDTSFTPPNWDDYTFGVWTPWWFGPFEDVAYSEPAFGGDVAFEECFDCFPFDDATYEEFSGRTDAGGTHYLQIDFDGDDLDLPSSVTAEATVFDVNRQAFAARTDLLIHPARVYVGLRSDRTFVERGDPIRIDAAVTDVDGTVIAGRPVEVTAGRVDYGYQGGRWGEELVDVQTCMFDSVGDVTDGSMRCEFPTDVGGTYRITAIVTDEAGDRNRTQLTQWVSGGLGRPSRGIERDEVTIVPDRETYAPGDTAELLVQAPFAPAYGQVIVTRAGVESVESFEAPDGSAVLRIPIEDRQIPNVTVRIDMVGAAPRTADDGTPVPEAADRPAFAVGSIQLSVPPVARTLDVVATPADDALEPGGSTTVTVDVRDAGGAPVAGAGVAVVVVDEAVLSLTGYELADPLAVFYRPVGRGISAQLLRESILLSRPDLATDAQGAGDGADELAEAAPAAELAADDAGAGRAAGSQGPQIDVRADFDALALFAPDESTGADGTVTVDVSVPDNLTRYRIMAVAVDGADRFGTDEGTLTARLPVMVRPSAPRFLNFGDTFDLPIVVQNQTDQPLDVDVALETANLALTDVAGKRVTVPANDRIEVRFAAAAEDVGTARFRVAGVSGPMADAATIALPVYTPATAEAFATYGVIDDGAIGQPLLAPTGVFAQFGGLEVSTSSTALQALTDAVLYLHEYRYDSADGYASRIMAIAALRDVLAAFDADGLPPADELNLRVQRDIEGLAGLQNGDGGWPWWQRGRPSVPWQSIQATHALVLADDAGYAVRRDTIDRALFHLAEFEQFIPPEYSQSTRDALSAYALHVRDLAGDRDSVKALDLYRRAGDSLQPDALAWIWHVLSDQAAEAEIERELTNRAVETPGAATFATRYGEDAYLVAHSDRRTDGVVLDALIVERPDSDLIPKVVAGLLGNQVRGRWSNAHENAFILLAMKRYFDTFEDVTPDFVARAWLGDLYAVGDEFRGRSTDTNSTLVPMSELVAAGDTTVVLDKDGIGRLYYRLGLRYAPDDLQLDARDEGFVVDRTYEAVDDPDDVQREQDGTWRIRAGATVRVRITMVADARRTNMALIDPLPAGLEAVNPSFAPSPTTSPPGDGSAGTARDVGFCCIWWRWFEHQNLRDDRAEAFASYLWAGTYDYSYVARATTPGTFVVPPARAEEVYAPEVFGRSASDIVVVE